MLLPHGILIALIDGEKFELYRNQGDDAQPELIAMPTPLLDESNKSSGVHHYSGARNPQDSLLQEDAHAAAVAEWLNTQAVAGQIERLVVFAAPRTLGELRRHWHKQLNDVLYCELPKEMVGHPTAEIIAMLREI